MYNLSNARNGLNLSSHLKYIEYVIGIVSASKSNDNLTIGDIKKSFKEKFNISLPYLCDQNFAILRLNPMIFIKADYENDNNKLHEDVKRKIKIIRDSIAHGETKFSENGICFISKEKGKPLELYMEYEGLGSFIYEVENKYFPNFFN